MAPTESLLKRTITPVLYEDPIISPDFAFDSGAELLGSSQRSFSPNEPKYAFTPVHVQTPYRAERASSKMNRVAPKSTMQMLSDAVYEREVERLSSERRGKDRPHSANMTTYLSSTFNPYETTYKHEYYQKEGEELFGRPMTHLKVSGERFRNATTYNTEFTGEKTTKNEKLWSGGNNPHPSQAFMVWKYPTRRDGEPVQHSAIESNLTNEQFDKVMRGKTRSTYQMDYRGLPQGFIPTEFAAVNKDWKSSVPYTLDSLQRISYQNPNQPSDLASKTDRYGHSGHDRHRLLVGIAPNASKRKQTVTHKTTYDRHYNDLGQLIQGEARVHFPTHARTVVKGKGPEQLEAMYERIRKSYFPKHAQNNIPQNGYTSLHPLPVLDSGVPRVSPGVGILPIPSPTFVMTPVPEPICEPI